MRDALKMLEKAEETIASAEYDLNGGFLLATANRAYYGCYYCMCALLDTQNVYAKTHQGVHAKFSELFIKSRLFPIETARDITYIFESRQQADYDLDTDFTADEAKDFINKAKRFYQLTKTYLHQLSSPSKG